MTETNKNTDPRELFRQAQALHLQDRLAEAAVLYAKLLESYPNNYHLLACAGQLALQQNRLEDTAKLLQRSLEIEKSQPGTLLNLAVALRRMGRRNDALECYDRAIALAPDFAEAYNNRGNLLKDLNRREEALTSFDKALDLRPDYAEAHFNKGAVLETLHRFTEALASYDRAMALNPEQNFLAGSRLHVKARLCDWCNFMPELADLVKRVRQGKKAIQTFPFFALVDSLSLHKQAAEIIARHHFPRYSAAELCSRRTRTDKINVGYYSADFRNHPIAYLTAELFERHDKSRFNVSAFDFGPKNNDALRQRVASAVDQFIDVRLKSDKEIAQLSRNLGIDIAIDFGGFTQDGRTGIFASRAAPIQVNYLGHPGTMGAAFIDYLIADKVVLPPESRHYYNEKIVYLPDSYMVSDTSREISTKPFTREEFGLPASAFVFCCFNNNYKILPEVFDRWMNILGHVEGSVLWLQDINPTASDNLRREAVKRGISGERLIFSRQLAASSEHLARHRLADLFIDTLPFNAHTTTNDALWAGLPVLTCAGESFAGRVAASLLEAIGLPELVTTDLQQYEALAIELARDPVRLAGIRAKLERNRRSAALFDTPRFTRNIEAAYTAMNERYHAGLPPDHITIRPF